MHDAAKTENPEPARYEIRVRGHLSETLLAAFPDLHAEAQGAETVLTGALPDQAALYGVLAQIEALRLELLEVRCERSRAASGESPGSGDDSSPGSARAFASGTSSKEGGSTVHDVPAARGAQLLNPDDQSYRSSITRACDD